jgi:hypothetical protein
VPGTKFFLWQGDKVAPEHKEMVSAYFSDIVGFTDLSSTLNSSKVQRELMSLCRCEDLSLAQILRTVLRLEAGANSFCFAVLRLI